MSTLRKSEAAVVAGIVVAVVAGVARADASFVDPTGDQTKPAAPDITNVQVTSTPDGTITFGITVANYQTLPPLSGVAIGIDVDERAETGSDGADVLFGYVVDPLGDPATLLSRWDEEEDDFVDVDPVPATVSAGFAQGVLTATVPRSELYYTSGFRFAVISLAFDGLLDSDPGFDFAPDGNDFWTYEDLVLPAPALSASPPKVTPRQPAAGKRLVVSTNVTRTDKSPTASPVTTTCTVRIGSTRVRTSSTFAATPGPIPLGEGQARCAMKIPKTAHGRTVRGSITARTPETSVKRPFTIRVR